MHYVYIIFSEKVNKYYVGETHNVEVRLNLHNQSKFKDAYTKIADDWQIVLKFECENRKEATFIERFIKRMKSRRFIEKVIKQPKILSDILSKSKF